MPVIDRWLWLGGSVLVALLSTWTAWFLRRQTWVQRLEASPFFPSMLQLFRFLYYIGGPFAALLWGRDAVVERPFGLAPLPVLFGSAITLEERLQFWTDGVRGLGWAVFLGAIAWTLLVVIWWAVGHRSNSRAVHPPLSIPTALREAFFQETHWMFYRNGPSVVLGNYWGAWVGVGIVALEAILNPWWWEALREPEKRPLTLIRAGMAILSAAFYLQSANLWLSILLHWGVTGGLAGWAAAQARREDS
ncbi:MAG: hypothetical protein N2556_02920 [Anaerolineae bacterium]|nr:hypothetical protein [Anaerolineae bacterium]